MNCLADLRRRLRNCIGRSDRTVSISFFSASGVERPGSQNAPVVIVRNREFAIKRVDGHYGYLYFQKVAEWTFVGNVATHTSKTGIKSIITINEH